MYNEPARAAREPNEPRLTTASRPANSSPSNPNKSNPSRAAPHRPQPNSLHQVEPLLIPPRPHSSPPRGLAGGGAAASWSSARPRPLRPAGTMQTSVRRRASTVLLPFLRLPALDSPAPTHRRAPPLPLPYLLLPAPRLASPPTDSPAPTLTRRRAPWLPAAQSNQPVPRLRRRPPSRSPHSPGRHAPPVFSS